jgi:hypothetical protein
MRVRVSAAISCLGQRAAMDAGVARPEGAVQALVAAEIGDVKRGKQDEPFPVDLLFDGAGRLENLMQELGVFHIGQQGDLGCADAFHLSRMFKNVLYGLCIRLLRGGKNILDLGFVNEHGGPVV